MTITRQSQKSTCVLMLAAGLVAAGFGQPSVANAQDSATLPADLFLVHVVDAQGGTITADSDPTTELYRRGTDPLAKLTRSDGTTPVTLDDFNDVTGQISISGKPSGGTDVVADLEGLLPGESYSFWAGYWPEPGFPQGSHLAFGAITTAGDGSDNWRVADADGKVSVNLVQQEGPMTVDGSASAYAPISPVLDLNGNMSEHAGYTIGVALHFGDFPPPPTLSPGPANTWALHAIADFAPIPEPSSVALMILATAGIAVFRWRRPTG